MLTPVDQTKAIVVAGYPKSGNTWTSRLVAEVVNCPVQGFWGEPNNREIAREGLDRSSDYRVFKAHQPYELLKSIGEIHGLIYVLRDPRDIVCSGAAYFKLRSFREKYGNNASKFDAMIHTIANGSNYPHCQIPWSDHVRGYLGTEAKFVRYEDLLEQPTKTIATLLAQLKIERSENRICQAVAAQSFDHVKDKFEKSGAVFKANFLRKGRKAAYLEELTPAQQSQITEGSSEIMKLHGYI